MRELIAAWRRRADEALLPSVATALRRCGNELEQAWHDHAHDGAWVADGSCRVCDEERQAEEQYENGMAADWPDERQLNDWNIHNDHADGMEADE